MTPTSHRIVTLHAQNVTRSSQLSDISNSKRIISLGGGVGIEGGGVCGRNVTIEAQNVIKGPLLTDILKRKTVPFPVYGVIYGPTLSLGSIHSKPVWKWLFHDNSVGL